MKPLNRPMFRYGGPIKEGVMSGIREPKRDGNIVGGRQSPKLAGAHPLKDASGREHHLLPAGYALGSGLNALRIGAMRMAPRIIQGAKNLFGTTRQFQGPVGSFTPGKLVASQAKGVRIPSSGSYSGVKFTRAPGTTSPSGAPMGEMFVPNFLGRDPTVRLVGGAYKAVTNPKVAGFAAKTARLVFSPTGLVTGAIYAGGKFFDSDGNEIDKDTANKMGLTAGDRVGTSGAPGGGDPGMYLTPQAKGGEGATLSKEELRKQRVDRYRDIMDIKGMNKDAAYDSLIAASKLIGESGDFKGDVKSGKLINQIIQSTSKAFDKPKATKDAIDTLILKGEIEKDIKASDPSNKILNEYRMKQMEIADKTLAGDTFTDIITDRLSKGKTPRGKELAGILRATEKVDVTVIDSTDIPQGVDAQTFFEAQVNEKISKGEQVVPGYYVIDDRVLVIDQQGKVSPIL